MGAEWTQIVEEVRAATARLDMDAALGSLVRSGPVLGRVLPRADDDVNELPDEMYVA